MELIVPEALRLALSVVDPALRRGNIWQALRGLDELRWRLQESSAVSHGLARPAHAMDSHASPDLQPKLSGVLADATPPSITRALANALNLLGDPVLTDGQCTLSEVQRAVLAALRQRTATGPGLPAQGQRRRIRPT